jgi:hypothetical protein
MNRIPKTGRLERRLASALGTIGLIFTSTPSIAQTLDGPESACPGEQLRVEWTGPNAAGDAVTVARVDDPADRFIHSAWTADGDPARFRAPYTPGAYELRYVQSNPREVLVKERLDVAPCGGAAVTFQGTQIDFGDEIDTSESTQYGQAGVTIEQLCGASNEIAWAWRSMIDHIEAEMHSAGAPVSLDMLAAVPGAPTRSSIERSMATIRDEVCDQPPPNTTVQAVTLTYAYCRMSMRTPTHAMDIYLPPGGGGGTMWMADHTSQEAMVMSLRPSVDQLATIVGKGWDEGLSMNGPGASGMRAGYPVSSYDFKYEVGLGGSTGPLAMLGQTVKVKNEGTAWVSSEVPGIDSVQMFYERLTTEMSPQGDSMSFFGGLISNIVAMLQYGIPLEMDQTTSSKALGAVGVSGRSQQFITGVELLDFDEEWCNETWMPADYTVTDIDQELAQSMGGQDSEEMAQAMQDYNEAMSQMTPEQRAMMESMGMGDMMRQSGAGNMPSGNPSGSNTSPPDTGCDSRSSKDLTTNNMLETVQLHLEALGYDPGNTDGSEALQTTIAISQFQAEKGLEVTGEVSPQLIGVLSAEVDSGC